MLIFKKSENNFQKVWKIEITAVSLHYQTNKNIYTQNLHKIMTASNNSKMQLAVQMVIMDAIEKGHTNSNELIDYMQSDVFATAAKSYFEMLNQI